MNPGDYTLNLYRGRARTWRAQLLTGLAGSTPANLTGCTPVAGISLPDGSKIALTCAVVVEDGVTVEDGIVSIAISEEDSALLTGTHYPWTMGVQDAGGDWNPCLKGAVIVTTDDSPQP